ncbi:lipophosphoglycan biosynthetic protein [Perkinsela sp. CCAP 1560/4]|nr:lipophosphoglycan biosynthetic protein [Perkinsela sp. CCAP 1560/4]|eukprot:KNH03620.1 lipophosphoglycan biosynthetic protein [Perkinsela sp. CCAP 1560/4]
MSRISVYSLLVFGILLLSGGVEKTFLGAEKGETHKYKAEVGKMLDILINSLYTNHSIFLREIISNASDALDKVRFLYLTKPKNPKNDAGKEPTMDVRILIDHETNELRLIDGGVGMTKSELSANLGSLGASGTKSFWENINESKNAGEELSNLIGQFGVGFYSVFLVADEVRVASKNDAEEKQWMWESKGDGKYFLYEDPRGNTLGRGTELVLKLKKEAEEYLQEEKLKKIIHYYSEFINFPIYVGYATKDEREKQDEKYQGIDWELVNVIKPIWTRNPQTVERKEYVEFYRGFNKEFDEPMYYSHFVASGGEIDFKALLYVPSTLPTNAFNVHDESSYKNMRLYVRRVFITDEFKDLFPRYLNFVQGVVDSDDLPLNVSRELLQENRVLKTIKKQLVRKALGMFIEISKEDDEVWKEIDATEDKELKEKKFSELKYPAFWDEYGKSLRLGLVEDGGNRMRITKLLRYRSSMYPFHYNKLVSLDDYVSRMKEKQNHIFFVVGEDIAKLSHLPVVEDAMNRGVEVLYMVDAIDEYVTSSVTDYSGYRLVNLALNMAQPEPPTELEESLKEKREEKYKPLIEWFGKLLEDHKVHSDKIVLCHRHTSRPAIIASPKIGTTANMARINKGQTLGDHGHKSADKIVEINHLSPIMDEIYRRVIVDENDEVAKNAAILVFETACLESGFEVEDLQSFSDRVLKVIYQGLDMGLDQAMLEEDLSQYQVESNSNADQHVEL